MSGCRAELLFGQLWTDGTRGFNSPGIHISLKEDKLYFADHKFLFNLKERIFMHLFVEESRKEERLKFNMLGDLFQYSFNIDRFKSNIFRVKASFIWQMEEYSLLLCCLKSKYQSH